MAQALLNGNKTVTATAKLATFTISCGSGGTGQHLHVNVSGYGELVDGGSYAVTYGTSWSAWLVADTGYNIGTVSASSGTVTAATSVTAKTAASKKKFTVTLGTHTGANVTLACSGLTSVTNGNLANVPYGSTVTATATAQDGYTVNSVSFS